ncbi:dTDP-4-amino-4,6-dideoxygalactose transaminase [Verrucomicrobia bacterium]|nr:dTDP-4-amino-4,6-dideoxygalactose transaminase [Verrucomicrobiota bacterium]
MKTIPFNKPYLTGHEFEHIRDAHKQGQLAGDGSFTKLCHAWLEENTGCRKALLTHSCTAALEMSAMLIDINPGDEIIMPSYTFVSTANAFALRGAIPVFADIRPDTLNIDENLIESLITPRTKAIVPVHYAGVSCEMDEILEIAKKNGLFVIEDSAQGICSSFKGTALGTMGQIGCLSFHETKNIHSGEGGAILINDSSLIERAEIIREKGTDRSRFFRGQVDKYTWIDLGSSYLPGELIAAFLYAQLEESYEITERRLKSWGKYHKAFKELERCGKLMRPVVPSYANSNGHIYYIILDETINRDALIEKLKLKGIDTVFHYQPLHLSPTGKKLGQTKGNLPVTEDISRRILRLPLWIGMDEQQRVMEGIAEVIM